MASTMSGEDKKARKRERQKNRRQIRDLEKRHADAWYNKPLEEWDEEELAHGRPRNAAGDFRGKAPAWVSREVHEEAIRRFTTLTQTDLRALVPTAIQTVENMIRSEEVDEKGRPLVPASVKLQAAQWVVEHLVGKPKQRLEADISVKLQGILAQAMVVPGESGSLIPAIDVPSWEDDDDDDGLGGDSES